MADVDEAPQVEWEWCSDSFHWNAYSPSISAVIEDAFQSSRLSVDVVISKSPYSVHFEKLQPCQKNLASGRTRPVKRQEVDGTSFSWLWWESERQFWHAYGDELAQKIETAWKECNSSKITGKKRAPAGLFFLIHKQAYSIEFERDGLQYNLKTQFSRGIRRRPCSETHQMSNGAGLSCSSELSSANTHDCIPSSSNVSATSDLVHDTLNNSLQPRAGSLPCDGEISDPLNNFLDLSDPPGVDCSICLCGLQENVSVSLSKCKHSFHRDCIESWFKNRPTCPECLTVYGTIIGSQPPGEMHVQYMTHRKGKSGLAGYPNIDIIRITYRFPNGIQSAEHPFPGRPYTGTVRIAYLPRNQEGEEVLELLRKAFDRRLLFRIGTSVTTGQNNVVTWAGIHHKTRMDGGSSHHGYSQMTPIFQELGKSWKVLVWFDSYYLRKFSIQK